MADDYCRIRVDDYEVGLVGLRQGMEEIALSHADKPDPEVQQALLDKLCKKNYIPSSARADYARAFVREFRKFLGQPYDEPASQGLSVLVLGPGCSQCNSLARNVLQALNEMKLPVAIEHITDLKQIGEHGIFATPALVINGKIVTRGKAPSVKRIKELLGEAHPE